MCYLKERGWVVVLGRLCRSVDEYLTSAHAIPSRASLYRQRCTLLMAWSRVLHESRALPCESVGTVGSFQPSSGARRCAPPFWLSKPRRRCGIFGGRRAPNSNHQCQFVVMDQTVYPEALFDTHLEKVPASWLKGRHTMQCSPWFGDTSGSGWGNQPQLKRDRGLCENRFLKAIDCGPLPRMVNPGLRSLKVKSMTTSSKAWANRRSCSELRRQRILQMRPREIREN